MLNYQRVNWSDLAQAHVELTWPSRVPPTRCPLATHANFGGAWEPFSKFIYCICTYIYIYRYTNKNINHIYIYIYPYIKTIETIKKIVAVLGYCHCCLFIAWRSKNKTLALPHAKWKALLKLRKVVLDAHGGVTMEEPWSLSGEQVIPHMLHVWYIYLHNWVVFWANVCKCW